MKLQTEIELERTVLGSMTILGRQLSTSAGILFNRRFGISIVDWAILAMLAQESKLSARQLSKLTVFDKALISRRLKYLNEAGFVSTKQDSKKRNRTQSSLTTKGRNLYKKVLPITEERERIFLSDFSSNEVKTLKKFLLKMQKNIPELLK